MYDERVSGRACEVSQEGYRGGNINERKAMEKDGAYGEKEEAVRHGELSLVTNPACEGKGKVPS